MLPESVDWHSILGWLALVSVVTFAGSMILVPYMAVRIPADYFHAPRRGRTAWGRRHPVLRLLLALFKNLLGFVLVLAGILMLFLPGQGLLTILIGTLFMNFPGKYRLERALVARGPVLRGINWIRLRAGREPLLAPCEDEKSL
jgi:hypothetical protein